jgi:hypothetical protein
MIAALPFASSQVYRGGPMDPDMLVMLIRNPPGSPRMRQVTDTIQASVSLQVLDELHVEQKPRMTCASTRDIRLVAGQTGAGTRTPLLAPGEGRPGGGVRTGSRFPLGETLFNRLEPLD